MRQFSQQAAAVLITRHFVLSFSFLNWPTYRIIKVSYDTNPLKIPIKTALLNTELPLARTYRLPFLCTFNGLHKFLMATFLALLQNNNLKKCSTMLRLNTHALLFMN